MSFFCYFSLFYSFYLPPSISSSLYSSLYSTLPHRDHIIPTRLALPNAVVLAIAQLSHSHFTPENRLLLSLLFICPILLFLLLFFFSLSFSSSHFALFLLCFTVTTSSGPLFSSPLPSSRFRQPTIQLPTVLTVVISPHLVLLAFVPFFSSLSHSLTHSLFPPFFLSLPPPLPTDINQPSSASPLRNSSAAPSAVLLQIPPPSFGSPSLPRLSVSTTPSTRYIHSFIFFIPDRPLLWFPFLRLDIPFEPRLPPSPL